MKKRWVLGLSLAALTALHVSGQVPSVSISWDNLKGDEAVAKPSVKPIAGKKKVFSTASSAIKRTTENPQLALSSADFSTCVGSQLLEVVETMDYKISVCYHAATSAPTQMHKLDKFSGQATYLNVTDYSHHEQGGVYRAEENGISYVIDHSAHHNSALENRENLGTFLVQERGTTWVQEPILNRTVVKQQSANA